MMKTQFLKQSQWWRKVIRTGILVLVIFVISIGFNPPCAFAEIRMSEHTPGRLLIQSRHNLKDNQGNAWNSILFKQAEIDGSDKVILRLVGFPGVTKFERSQPLEIATRRGQIWVTNDLFAKEPPAENVAQYDMKEILPQLPNFTRLRLSFRLMDDRLIKIDVPRAIVLEWKTVIADGQFR